jgi:hypothetical protein
VEVVIPTGRRRHRAVHIDIICRAVGLTTAAYSFGYVAGWSGGDPRVVRATADRVVTAARTILHDSGILKPRSTPAPIPETVAA